MLNIVKMSSHLGSALQGPLKASMYVRTLGDASKQCKKYPVFLTFQQAKLSFAVAISDR